MDAKPKTYVFDQVDHLDQQKHNLFKALLDIADPLGAHSVIIACRKQMLQHLVNVDAVTLFSIQMPMINPFCQNWKMFFLQEHFKLADKIEDLLPQIKTPLNVINKIAKIAFEKLLINQAEFTQFDIDWQQCTDLNLIYFKSEFVSSGLEIQDF